MTKLSASDNRRIEPPPKSLFVAPGFRIPVRVETPPSDKSLGCWSEQTGEIYVSPQNPPYESWIILLHEMMHAVESMLQQQGIIKRKVGEPFIEHASCRLLGILAQNGLLTSIPADVAKRWVRKTIKAQENVSDGE